MTSTVEFQASHIIAKDDLWQWLAEYGIDITQVVDVRIEIGRHYGDGNVQAWLDVEWMAVNHLGSRYVRGEFSGPAKGHTTIPLRSFPTLTPVSPEEE